MKGNFQMIDLHMHTIYSDGELTPDMVLGLCRKIEIISVTDHNSVGMALNFAHIAINDKAAESILKNFIVGTEITIEGYPDLLVYYPHISIQNFNVLQEIEQKLQVIRVNEELAVKEAYSNLGFCEWEIDKKRAFPIHAHVTEARTRELASICYGKRTGNISRGFFETEDLRKARIARRGVIDNHKYIKDNPYVFSKSTLGELVLAHPIRTAIKRADKHADFNRVIRCLYELVIEFIENDGQIIEWEYLDCEMNQDFSRYPALQGHCKSVREHIKKIIDMYSLKCIWGSDTHIQHPKDYKLWGELPYLGLTDCLPSWVSIESFS